MEYVERLRLGKAQVLLIHTDIQIIEIAHQTGYNNLSTFNYAFSKLFGMSPKKFKKFTAIYRLSAAKAKCSYKNCTSLLLYYCNSIRLSRGIRHDSVLCRLRVHDLARHTSFIHDDNAVTQRNIFNHLGRYHDNAQSHLCQ